MQPAPTSESQPTTDFSEYTWVPGKRDQWDSACVRKRTDGRTYVGLKGYDRKRGGPGYISIEMADDQLRGLIAALQASLEAA